MKESNLGRCRSFELYKPTTIHFKSKRSPSYAQVGVKNGDQVVSSKNVYPYFETIRKITFGLVIPKPYYPERIDAAGKRADRKANLLNGRP